VIIFDFDQTLVDTSPVESLRAQQNWKAVMTQAPRLKVYDGINTLLSDLYDAGQILAIVTKSPDMVPKAFIKQHAWPIAIVIGYHHVKRRKPDPEGLLLAMQKAGASVVDTYHIGDQPEDTYASRAAGVRAIGSAWGVTDMTALQASKPDHLFTTVADLRRLLLVSLPR
jgi:phosphoglycolate phosphatase-like HAD superfamily hydrolase